MRKILAIMIFFFLFMEGIWAQQVSITSFVEENSDDAVTASRNDLNGVPCALIKVKTPVVCSFMGNVIGDPIRKEDGYWVYVTGQTPATKSIAIAPKGALNVDVVFANYGIEKVQPSKTYVLTLSQGDAKLASYQDMSEAMVQGESKDIETYSVDLGLSVRWATMNIGANEPEEEGYYIAWGETAPKENYGMNGTPLANKTPKELRLEGLTVVGNKLAPNYDAATMNWGPGWRMPTFDEVNELRGKCTWEYCNWKGHDGFLITGPNGNEIFMPVATESKIPCAQFSTEKIFYKSPGFTYWTGQPSFDSKDEKELKKAAALFYVSLPKEYEVWKNDGVVVVWVVPRGDANRGCGFLIRPVVTNQN